MLVELLKVVGYTYYRSSPSLITALTLSVEDGEKLKWQEMTVVGVGAAAAIGQYSIEWQVICCCLSTGVDCGWNLLRLMDTLKRHGQLVSQKENSRCVGGTVNKQWQLFNSSDGAFS